MDDTRTRVRQIAGAVIVVLILVFVWLLFRWIKPADNPPDSSLAPETAPPASPAPPVERFDDGLLTDEMSTDDLLTPMTPASAEALLAPITTRRQPAPRYAQASRHAETEGFFGCGYDGCRRGRSTLGAMTSRLAWIGDSA